MRKNTIRRNFLTIYVREAYKPIVEKFLSLISKDDEVKRLADKKRPENYMSVAIIYLMDKYNQSKENNINTEEIEREEVSEEE